MDDMIDKEPLYGVFDYVDNVVICVCGTEPHERNLRWFPEVSTKYGLTFNEGKSTTSVKTIKILGFEVSKGHIRPGPEKPNPLKALPPPQNFKAQKRIVGRFAY